MGFDTLPPEEIERRRQESISALGVMGRERFAAWYQEKLDRHYWAHGRSCAGCDHWSSDSSLIGECMSAPPVSGADVLRSLGITFSTYTPAPGQPYTTHDHVCGAFKDDFDWTTLDPEYLKRIGAPNPSPVGSV